MLLIVFAIIMSIINLKLYYVCTSLHINSFSIQPISCNKIVGSIQGTLFDCKHFTISFNFGHRRTTTTPNSLIPVPKIPFVFWKQINCCLQGQLCGLCLWFWPKRKMRIILWIKITLQNLCCRNDAAKMTLQNDVAGPNNVCRWHNLRLLI